MAERGQLLRRILAVLIALRAATNFQKPFSDTSGFVILGKLMHGVATTVVAPLFGIAMLVYAWGLWQGRAWARPLAVAYALWATANVVLFPIIEGVPSKWAPWMYSIFAVPGILIPWLAVWLLRRP
jgi:hypothetical protein